jgi:hypothetical protein
MRKFKPLVYAVLMCWAAATALHAADRGRRVIIYEDVVTEVGAPAEASTDLWVTLKDLTRATRFALKPQGVCRGELCFPIPKGRRSQFIARRSGITWFNLSEFARLLKQPVASDSKLLVWYFGPRPENQNAYLATLVAPDFTLPDLAGKPHSLSDFRGRKVLLITWASW